MQNTPSKINFQLLFETTPGLYMILKPDSKFTIVTANKAYLDATMTKLPDIVGRGVFEVFPDNPNDPNAVGERNLSESLHRVVAQKVSDNMEVIKYDIRRPDSEGGGFEERFWHPINSPVLGTGNELLYITHCVQDVTELMLLKRKEAEQEKLSEELKIKAQKMELEVLLRSKTETERKSSVLSKHNIALKQIDQLKTEFFANVSHELRTPLTLILGPVQQLLNTDQTLNEGQRKTLEVIARNARMLLKHVNDLLDISKLEAGKMTLKYGEVDLSKLIRLTAAYFETSMQTKKISFVVETPDFLPIQIDEEKIHRVFMNLLSNAYKFVPSGGTVRCSVVKGEEDVIITVSDNGPGVKPEFRKLIFERFVQADGGVTRNAGGTGLGLAITKDFVELHQGTIEVTESPSGGAAFVVRLPLFAPVGSAVKEFKESPKVEFDIYESEAKDLEEAVSGQVIESPAERSDQALVLVVEDNLDMSEFIVSTLAAKFQVVRAFNGKDGLEKAMTFVPDLIITDYMMPKMSGDQMIKEIRAKPEMDNIPIIILTAKVDEDLKHNLLGEGCQDYLSKPFSQKELMLRAQNLIAMKQTRDLLSQEVSIKSTDLTVLTKELTFRNKELKHAVVSVEVTREQAVRANQAKSHFLNLISHELHTPLTSIILTLEVIMERGGLSQENIKSFNRIMSSSKNLRTLIESLLNYSRVESGRLKVDLNVVDLPMIVTDVIAECEPLAISKNLKLSKKYSGDVGRFTSDPKLIRIVLNNLITNALKYTEQGEVEISISQSGSEFAVKIKDTGPGITRESQARIFEPFEQLVPLKQKGSASSGVGLGLTLVKGIVKALSGTIDLQSELDKGSVFTVKLPSLALSKNDTLPRAQTGRM